MNYYHCFVPLLSQNLSTNMYITNLAINLCPSPWNFVVTTDKVMYALSRLIPIHLTMQKSSYCSQTIIFMNK